MTFTVEPPGNAAALELRASLPSINDFRIDELVKMPAYWGWVGGSAEPGYAPFRMFLGGHDGAVALRLFWNGCYEPTALAAWNRLCRKASLALDIGAHTGVYTLAARAANLHLAVLSFEPYFMNFARCTLNLRANGYETTDAYMIGVGDKTERKMLNVRMHEDFSSSGATFTDVGVDAQHISVPVVALDEFLPDPIARSVDLIKLDVEGHEPECLAGMAGMIEKTKPTFLFECSHANTASAFEAILSPMGYGFFLVDECAGALRAVEELKPYLNWDESADMSRVNRIAAVRDADLAILSTMQKTGGG